MNGSLQEHSISSHEAIKNCFESQLDNIKVGILNSCEDILSTVVRWEKGEIKAINSRETNREHILGMLDLVWEFYDELSNICNIDDLIIMILIHDLGEYRIGDIAQSEKGAEDRKRIQKKHEKKVATILIKQIKDPKLQERCLQLLKRYFEFGIEEDQPIHEVDRLYLIAKFFDAVQGLEYGLETVFKENYKTKRAEVTDHIRSNFQDIYNTACFLDANVILGALTGYREYPSDMQDEKKKEQQKNLDRTTTDGIYGITSMILYRIRKKIYEDYGFDVIANLGRIIDHFETFPEDKRKPTSPQ